MKVTIFGGGNIGTQFAVHCAEKGHTVTIFTKKPEKFSKEIYIVDDKNSITHKGIIACVTSNPKVAFIDTELIFVTVPAFLMENAAKAIRPYFKKGMSVALVPGTGGGECVFADAISKGCTVFGFQRTPSVARLVEHGRSVCASGYRESLYVSALPIIETQKCCSIVSEIFNMPANPMPNYLSVTMTPSNPILHTSRLRSLFKDYKEGIFYNSIPLFYEEWSMDSSELLIKNDQEVQNICKSLSLFDLRGVKSLKKHYESENAEQLTEKMRSIKSLQGLPTPSLKVENGWIPDLSSRYFTADFPYGLEILVQIGNLAGVNIPNMQETLSWYYSLTNEHKHFRYSDYGINTLNDFIEFYSF